MNNFILKVMYSIKYKVQNKVFTVKSYLTCYQLSDTIRIKHVLRVRVDLRPTSSVHDYTKAALLSVIVIIT